MRDEGIMFLKVAVGLFFALIVFVYIVAGRSSANCVTQAIEAKISADDIQKICYNLR